MQTPNAWIAVAIVAPLSLALGLWSVVQAASYQWPEDVRWADGEAAGAFEAHFNEHFPLRTLGQNLWGALRFRLLAEGRDGLIVGEQGWFFTEQEFRPYPQAQAHLHQHVQWIRAVDRHLAERGIDLAIALVPSKARIYAEYRGSRDPSPVHQNLYRQARRQLRSAGLLVPDLLAAMERCKGRRQVFLKTDTHWTPAGADCVAESLAADRRMQLSLDGAESGRFEARLVETVQHRGDLMNYLPLAPVFESLLPPPEPVPRIETAALQSASAQALFGEPASVPVALVGTSYSADPLWHFTGALQQALARDVVNLAEAGHGPFRPMARFLASDALQSTRPRLVIWEIPERYLVQPDTETELPPLRTTHARRHMEIRV